VADSTFGGGRPGWLDRLGNVRNVVQQEMIFRPLDKHLPKPRARVLDVGAGQGTPSMRLARAGHQVLAVEPARRRGERLDEGPPAQGPRLTIGRIPPGATTPR